MCDGVQVIAPAVRIGFWQIEVGKCVKRSGAYYKSIHVI